MTVRELLKNLNRYSPKAEVRLETETTTDLDICNVYGEGPCNEYTGEITVYIGGHKRSGS